MKTTARFVLSASIGLGLAAFTLVSAFVPAVDVYVTLFAFALLAIYGLIELAILSYARPRPLVRRPQPLPSVARASVPVRARVRVRVPAVVELPAANFKRRAA